MKALQKLFSDLSLEQLNTLHMLCRASPYLSE